MTLGELLAKSLLVIRSYIEEQNIKVNELAESNMKFGEDYRSKNKIWLLMFEFREKLNSDHTKLTSGNNTYENFDNIYNTIPKNCEQLQSRLPQMILCFHVCDVLTPDTKELINQYCEWVLSGYKLDDNCTYKGLIELDKFHKAHCVMI